jgi:hypothetical protein
MNTNEKKIFFSVFIFNLLILFAIITLVILGTFALSDYIAESFPEYSQQVDMGSNIIVCIWILLTLLKIKPLYVDTKKTTLNYLENIKD